MIAKVIVDIPASNVNKTFDYLIPKTLEASAQPGMRVAVPFGPRKLQGFILSITKDATVSKLKRLQELLDPVPVLTSELLSLGQWLSEETLCFLITAFQAMIPSALKATYKKEFALSQEQHLSSLPSQVMRWFNHRTHIPYDEIVTTEPELLPVFQKLVTAGTLEVIYKMNDKVTKKKIKVVYPNQSVGALQTLLAALPPQALKQKEVLHYVMNEREGVVQSDLLTMFDASRSTVTALEKKGAVVVIDQELYRDPFAGREFKKTTPLTLTAQQEESMRPMVAAVEEERHETFLLHGVTGSGKTEVYLQTIEAVLQKGKEAIVLVPEISLTPQMVLRFKGRFGSRVAVMHSGLSAGEKYDEWRKIQRKEVSVVVGARSAVFAPFENLGLIIIDEEHESSYKQEENPRYHARDVAIHRGLMNHCPVILGSATPSLETYARAQKGVYTLCELLERVNSRELPAVEIVDMREELRNGNRSMFSEDLFAKLQDRLQKGEQSVLFLNRRGYSSFILCRDCGYVGECPHCDISLTYHKKHHTLRCHYCGYAEEMPTNCPSCESSYIRFFGTGTQKVEEELAKLLPEARVIRMDVDTTSRKGSHEKLLSQFGEGKADILLGTQMIAKGLDFPKVTLVGVLAADTMLHLPDFRASEKTFQLLTQVSGRAGRHELEGEVVIQSYTVGHYSIELASKHDYHTFYKEEMAVRQSHRYPPYYYLTLLSFSHPDVLKVVDASEKCAGYLRERLSERTLILGPVVSPIARIKDRYRYQVMIKYKNEPALSRIIQELLQHFQPLMDKEGLHISVDMNAQQMM
ncbi:primosome assembly protein PriA [Fictibacillus macauensis ZFHKF-1]|uniref:Replication restart protein PriA n=1 Tax=Fictibacillus macauensis ZFHKF-1 TaxID=1196324 RepID=I8AHX3_9BACL|nr:primosomal protein N' [Fictibacillus macauensis]EIT85034.1 primosome assembly protein PriA [Fictibacillus macauensis ZFHKF-1]